jgi:transcriptional regulator with XRE-family HTH domain
MKKTKSEIDEYIGSRIRGYRLALQLTQEQLASALNVSFQQVQNYEKGINGISAVRLFDICKILNVSLASMFPPDDPKNSPQPVVQPPMEDETKRGATLWTADDGRRSLGA